MDRHLDLLSGTVAVGPFNMPRMYDMVIKKKQKHTRYKSQEVPKRDIDFLPYI